MRTTLPGSWIIPLLMVSCMAALGAPSADEVMSKAKAQAAKEQKSIFLDFSASW